ncbi:MAG: MFS transporter [Chloroflexota bacterium]|nr:MFS transporter [Chloroflexota bacterium]MDE2950457.1 MFS transporter [Chloroflexota bacterium]
MYASNINKIVLINFCQRFHLYIHAYALLLLGRGLTLVQISLIESVVIFSIFLMEVPTGVLADRVGRKWSIFASTFLLMSAEFIFIFAREFQWYLFIALLTGAGFAFASGAMEAMIYDSLPEKGREDAMKRAMGRVNSFAQIAFVIAPILGGLIIGDASVENFIPAIALTVLALLLGLFICLTLREPSIDSTDSAEKKAGSMTLLRDGLSLLLTQPRLRRLALLVIFTSPFTGAMVTTLGPPYLAQNEASPFVIGVALSLGSLLAALTQRYAYKVEERLGQARAIALLILLPGALYWILAAVAGPIAPVLVIILMYGVNDMKAPLFSAYQNALIESKNRATVLSMISMFLSLFMALGLPLYAALAQRSLSLTFVVMGAVIVLAGLLLGAHRLTEAGDRN